jgi:small subunit ribosomal protein S7
MTTSNPFSGRFQDPSLDRLVSAFIRHGHRSRAERTISALLVSLKKQFGPAQRKTLSASLDQITPRVSLRGKKRAGISYRIPFILSQSSGPSFALRWLRQSLPKRTERSLDQRLFRELLDARSLRGEAYRRRESLHQLALLNRGFVKFLR